MRNVGWEESIIRTLAPSVSPAAPKAMQQKTVPMFSWLLGRPMTSREQTEDLLSKRDSRGPRGKWVPMWQEPAADAIGKLDLITCWEPCT